MEVKKIQIHNFSQSGDKTLDLHLFDHLPVLKPIDFNSPAYYSKFKIKNAETKEQLFKQTATKLQILLETYSKDDFDRVKFYRLNADQILVFLTSPNFINNSRLEKVVEALQHLRKCRQLTYYNRPEVMNVVKSICTNHKYLSSMEPSYVASLAYTTMQMGVKDEEIWFSLADFLLNNHSNFSLRSLSSYMLALHHASAHSPITLDFSPEFSALELPLIQKFDAAEENDYASLTQVIIAYSKAQLGSVEFFQALEKYIIQYANEDSGDGRDVVKYSPHEGRQSRQEFSFTEIANIMYSYALNDN